MTKEDYTQKPAHLGGHGMKTNTDETLIKHLKENYNTKSLLDLGCGPGGMKDVCKKYNISWYGIDGDHTVITDSDETKLHDFTKGPLSLERRFDVVWCTEFLEHVEEQYVDNYMPLFKLGNMSIITAAPPGHEGYHHVNCKDLEYWTTVFEKYDLKYNEILSEEFKSVSTMRKDFFKKTGMVFTAK